MIDINKEKLIGDIPPLNENLIVNNTPKNGEYYQNVSDPQSGDFFQNAPAPRSMSFNTTPDVLTSLTPFVSTVDAPDVSKLSGEDWRKIDDISAKIDLTNSANVISFGSDAQKQSASFSTTILANISNKDSGEVGNMLTGLTKELGQFSETKKGGLFKKAGNSISNFRLKYQSVEKSIDNIVVQLQQHNFTLLKDIQMLDQLYNKNFEYLKEVTYYIIAGKRKLEETERDKLQELRQKAIQSGKMEDVYEANALAELCVRFDKKLYDLQLTRIISLQTGPQIRMVQSADLTLSEKIQSTIVNTIPLWKNQIVLTLGLIHTQNALNAQRAVTDMTNNLLKKNAELLKTGVVGVAKESERGIVDIETLRQTNQSLVSTLDEVINIQNEGRRKRRDAEKELQSIENDMKQKLLSINMNNNNNNDVN